MEEIITLDWSLQQFERGCELTQKLRGNDYLCDALTNAFDEYHFYCALKAACKIQL